MPNGVKPADPLDALSSVGAAYRSGGQPGNCKYWILDLGTRAAGPPRGAAMGSPCALSWASTLRRAVCLVGGLCGHVPRGPLGMRRETGPCPVQSR